MCPWTFQGYTKSYGRCWSIQTKNSYIFSVTCFVQNEKLQLLNPPTANSCIGFGKRKKLGHFNKHGVFTSIINWKYTFRRCRISELAERKTSSLWAIELTSTVNWYARNEIFFWWWMVIAWGFMKFFQIWSTNMWVDEIYRKSDISLLLNGEDCTKANFKLIKKRRLWNQYNCVFCTFQCEILFRECVWI